MPTLHIGAFQVKLKPTKRDSNDAPAVDAVDTVDASNAVHAADRSVSPSDVNLSNMAAQMAANMAAKRIPTAKRATTPPRVRTPERAQQSRRNSSVSTKSRKAEQLPPPKTRQSADPGNGELQLPTLTPLAQSMATNAARARARAYSTEGNDEA